MKAVPPDDFLALCDIFSSVTCCLALLEGRDKALSMVSVLDGVDGHIDVYFMDLVVVCFSSVCRTSPFKVNYVINYENYVINCEIYFYVQR